MFFKRIKRIHMVGIGGSGMSGMAEILLSQAFDVSGCDAQEQPSLDHLRSLGAVIHVGHSPDHVEGSEVVVYSSAISPDHPELLRAKELRIPAIKRAKMLGELTRLGLTVAVSGTHGKTTTTSILGYCAEAAGLDPTLIVGGRLTSRSGHARVGSGPFIIEGDEYDHSLETIHPTLALLTVVDADHLDCYRDFEEIKQIFLAYLQEVPFFGMVILNLDDPVQEAYIPVLNRPVVTYGTSEGATYRLSDIALKTDESAFTLTAQPWNRAWVVHLPLMGLHNVFNTAGALAALADLTGSDEALDRAVAALPEFPGVSRRFECIGSIHGSPVISDYAHHPREIFSLIASARQAYPSRTLSVLFQPHLYSRTKIFARDFAGALFPADNILLLPVYPAREEPIEGVDSHLILEHLKSMGHANVHLLPSAEEALALMQNGEAGEGPILIVGAGSIHNAVLSYLGRSS